MGDSKSIIAAIHEQMLHLSVNERLNSNLNGSNKTIDVVRGETVNFSSPKLEEIVIENEKTLGCQIKLD